jgi:hypothetical protein
MERLTAPHNTKTINQEVNVSAFYFKNRAARLASFPKQMEFGGDQYHFRDNGLRYLVRHGQRLVELFDVSDGRDTFRLRNEGADWRLVTIKVGQ